MIIFLSTHSSRIKSSPMPISKFFNKNKNSATRCHRWIRALYERFQLLNKFKLIVINQRHRWCIHQLAYRQSAETNGKILPDFPITGQNFVGCHCVTWHWRTLAAGAPKIQGMECGRIFWSSAQMILAASSQMHRTRMEEEEEEEGEEEKKRKGSNPPPCADLHSTANPRRPAAHS